MAQNKLAMQPTEFAELRAAVAAVGMQDVHLGRVLDLLVLHLGHAHGLDPTAEDARLADLAKEEEAAASAVTTEQAAPSFEPAQEGAS